MTSVVPLGRIESVPLRHAWPNEASNFTPWLAEDANLLLLSDTLGLSLEFEAVEKAVGPFSADILAKETGTDRWIIIENQIEPTDHRHLGQLLTYAAGLDAKVIVWIAESFREEHRAALDFLNRVTTDEIALFGVQVELYRIGDSAFAPSFRLVAKPNNWSKSAQAGKQAAEAALTASQIGYRDFWASLIAEADATLPSLAGRTPYKGNWQTAERLFSSKKLVVDVNATFAQGRLRAEIYVGGALAKAAFHRLHAQQAAIEASFGERLDWEELPAKQDSRISLYMPGEQRREDAKAWSEQRRWLLGAMRRLSQEFRPRFAALDLSSLDAEEEAHVQG